jgi:hypothetical protein
MTLVKALKKFNRKERYWLIRNAFGENSRKLDPKFLRSLEGEHSIKVPENAWWAMDYHLDWLVAALHLFKCEGKGESFKRQDNPKQTLVNGTQLDVDLIIAFDKTLIFIEAKGDAGWDYEQLNRKIRRLQNIAIADARYLEGVKTYFILMAPKAQRKPHMEEIDAVRPDWIFPEGTPRWLDLQIENEDDQKVTTFEDFNRVGRCNKEETPCKTGDFFLVK